MKNEGVFLKSFYRWPSNFAPLRPPRFCCNHYRNEEASLIDSTSLNSLQTDHNPPKSQSGAVLIEYVIAAAILIPIFIVAGFILERAINSRGKASLHTVEQSTPRNPDIANLRADETNEHQDNTYLDDHGPL